MTHLQSYDKITSYTTVGTFCQKEWYLLCRIVYMNFLRPRSPPNLAMKDLVLEQVVQLHHPACTKKEKNIRKRKKKCPIAATDTELSNGANDGV